MHLAHHRIRGRLSRVTVPALAAAATAFLFGCGAGSDSASGPVLPGNPDPNPQLTRVAFLLDVNTKDRKVKITKPALSTQGLRSATAWNGPKGAVESVDRAPSLSILGGDVIDLTTSNYFASTVGAFTPNKVRVRFDVNITNQLSGVQIITPTFPTPPAGASGVLLFPFATNVTTTSGGVSTGGDGTDIIVELPNTGQVAASADWDGDGTTGVNGNPFNFFNDTGCPAGSNDCYRYEVFAGPILPGATTTARTVGFDIDPTVGNFRAKLIIAGDLQNSGPAPVGTVAGTVTSPQAGALTGVTIAVTPGTATGTSGAGGVYSIANVAIGPKTVAITGGLPTGCTNPGSQSITVSNGVTSTVNFTVTCPTPVGTVAGTITRTGAGTQSLAGVTVTATPAAAGTSASTALSTGAASPFAYSVANVQIGSGTGAGNGTVTLSGLPAGCTAPAPASYTGLTSGGSATVNFTVSCVVPPSFYQYSTTWGAISGGTVTLTIRFDPSTLNSPTVNGASPDDFNTIQLLLGYSPTRLQFVGCANSAGSTFTNVTANLLSAGSISLLNFKTGAGSITAQDLGTCTFNVLAGTAATVSTSSTLQVISSFNGDDLIPNTQKTEGSLSIP